MKKIILIIFLFSLSIIANAQLMQIGNVTLNRGANGADGVIGTDGLSAYEIAVNNGFVGTENEWITSLQGADGADMVIEPSKIAYLSTHKSDKNTIDLVNKLISLYSFNSYIIFSDDLSSRSIVSDVVLDYSAFTTGRWLILTFNRTKTQFEITDNVTGLQYPADNNYYVTSFYNHASTSTAALPINGDAFIVKQNNGNNHQPVNWTVLGDSHTASGNYTGVVRYYYNASTDYTNEFFNYTNLGVSGSTVANNGTSSFYQRRTQIPATTDLLTIYGGHNDHGTSTLGALATTTYPTTFPTTTFDDTTFYGAYQAIIEYALSINPAMRIQLVIPHPAYASNVKRDMSAFNQAIRDVGEYYGLPVLDLDADLGYNQINQDQYLTDGLHMNTYGGHCIGKRLYEFIKDNY